MNKWQQAYMDTAERFGALSTAKRLQVGAIVVKDNRIISIGYNGMPSGWDNVCEWTIDDAVGYDTGKTKPEVLHAEENAIAKLASSHESGKGSEIYITHSPCMNCAKLIYASGITKVYYKHKYRSEDGIHFLEKCGLEVKQL
jgi:dCMP deaminase